MAKREERQGNPVRDEQGRLVHTDLADAASSSSASGGTPSRRDSLPPIGLQNAGPSEESGARRRSTTMSSAGADVGPEQRMSRLDGAQEQQNLRRRGSLNSLSSSSASRAPPINVDPVPIWHRFQQTNGHPTMKAADSGVKSFPDRGWAAGGPPASTEGRPQRRPDMPSSSSEAEEWASAPAPEPERSIAPRGRRPSLGQLM